MILAGNSFSAYCKTPLHSTPCDGMGCVRALGVRGFRTLSSQSHLTKPNRGVSLAVHSCRIYRRILPPGGCPSPNLASLLYLNLALSSWKPESAEHRALSSTSSTIGEKKKKTHIRKLAFGIVGNSTWLWHKISKLVFLYLVSESKEVYCSYRLAFKHLICRSQVISLHHEHWVVILSLQVVNWVLMLFCRLSMMMVPYPLCSCCSF